MLNCKDNATQINKSSLMLAQLSLYLAKKKYHYIKHDNFFPAKKVNIIFPC